MKRNRFPLSDFRIPVDMPFSARNAHFFAVPSRIDLLFDDTRSANCRIVTNLGREQPYFWEFVTLATALANLGGFRRHRNGEDTCLSLLHELQTDLSKTPRGSNKAKARRSEGPFGLVLLPLRPAVMLQPIWCPPKKARRIDRQAKRASAATG